MMIKQITIECSKTINLGNYNNIKIGGSVLVEVPDDADEAAYQQLKQLAHAELRSILDETWKEQRTNK